MKAIMMSIRPEWVAKILNGDKTIEIRKKFPKGYVGWVYIYVTKNHKHAGWKKRDTLKRDSHDGKPTNHFQLWTDDMVEDNDKLNGKVVARFWCDKVEDFEFCEFSKHKDNLELYNECVRKDNELCKKACISYVKMVQYLDTKAIGKDMFGKAIHITKLEIFDKPKEISEFSHYDNSQYQALPSGKQYRGVLEPLSHAPQSFCFIEV